LIEREIGGRLAASYTVRTGIPIRRFSREAEDRGVDLIVVAAHGHSGMEHMLFGSTADRIVRHAHCAVLTVRPEIGERTRDRDALLLPVPHEVREREERILRRGGRECCKPLLCEGGEFFRLLRRIRQTAVLLHKFYHPLRFHLFPAVLDHLQDGVGVPLR